MGLSILLLTGRPARRPLSGLACRLVLLLRVPALSSGLLLLPLLVPALTSGLVLPLLVPGLTSGLLLQRRRAVAVPGMGGLNWKPETQTSQLKP